MLGVIRFVPVQPQRLLDRAEKVLQTQKINLAHNVEIGSFATKLDTMEVTSLEWPARSSSTGCKKDFYINL